MPNPQTTKQKRRLRDEAIVAEALHASFMGDMGAQDESAKRKALLAFNRLMKEMPND